MARWSCGVQLRLHQSPRVPGSVKISEALCKQADNITTRQLHTTLDLLITWFQDSQAKSFKTQDNFATVNAEKSGEGEEKGGEKSYLFLISLTKLQSYKRN